MDTKRTILIASLMMILPVAAQAYVGPGLGAGAIAAVFGVIGSVFLALFAVIYYPIKRTLRKRKKTPSADAGNDGTPE